MLTQNMSNATIPKTLIKVSLGRYARKTANPKHPTQRNTPKTTEELQVL